MMTSSKFRGLERDLYDAKHSNDWLNGQVEELTRRIYALEQGGVGARPAPQQSVSTPAPSAAPTLVAEALPAPVPESVYAEEIISEPPPPPPFPEFPIEPLPEPELVAASVPEKRSSAEWEALIGGNWLLNFGVLLFVVGIGLLLTYSLTQFGPAGKIAVGYLVSFCMLAAGMFAERRELYRTFGRGLIGGGWAAIYFTTFAVHSLPAARLIESPVIGGALLLVVAVGMILHSMRYHSEKVTALAFFIAFLTLNITDTSAAALVATVPLTVFLALLAQRFGWFRLAVAGIVYSYGTFVLQHLQPPKPDDILIAQCCLWAYWLVFEAFDLMDLQRTHKLSSSVFPLNACGMMGAALLPGSPFTTKDSLTAFLTASAVLYLAGAIIRSRLGRVSDETHPMPGSYELSLGLSAGLVVAVIFRRFTGLTVNIALLMEGEFLVLAGLLLRQNFLGWLGGAVLVLPACKLPMWDVYQPGNITVGGVKLLYWTPTGILTAFIAGLNRRITKASPVYSYAATIILAFTLANELPARFIGVAWLGMAVVLFELRLRTNLREFRFQSYALGTLAFGMIVVVKAMGLGMDVAKHPWYTLGAASLLTAAGCVRVFRLAPGRIPLGEQNIFVTVVSSMSVLLVGMLMWFVLPSPLIATGWAMLALLLFEISPAVSLPVLRVHTVVLAMAIIIRVLLANFTIMAATAGVSHRILTVVPIVAMFYYFTWRLVSSNERGVAAGFYAYTAWGLLIALIRFEAGRTMAVVGWSVFVLALVWLGIQRNERHLRLQANLLALATFGRSWATNFYVPGAFSGVPVRVATGVFVAAAFYASQFLSPRAQQGPWPMERYARTLFSVLATSLITILLFYEVSGSMLTVALGLQGITLLMLGFPLQERVFRLSGMAIFLFCVMKLFFYDLRQLDTLSRIVSFIVLGLLMMGASWVYTRYREQVRRML